MLEAKDTVMSDKVLLQKMLGLPDTSTITEYAAQQDMSQPPGSYYKAGVQAQAEISFKAGYKLAVIQNETPFRAGIREVVEWIEGKTFTYYAVPWDEKSLVRNLFECDFQAKLKDWGIK